ncbi:hypothetical protein [Actinoplanes awajinensis]|uniref:hypothetical protein n=1 Tax=Actinoplanes awajinensis TaxID=135946 RepID=UPI000AD530D3|nr:hypothetical protein [Actinoplanes awajinensis]
MGDALATPRHYGETLHLSISAVLVNARVLNAITQTIAQCFYGWQIGEGDAPGNPSV